MLLGYSPWLVSSLKEVSYEVETLTDDWVVVGR